MSQGCGALARKIGKVTQAMPKSKSRKKAPRRASTAQLVFLVLTVVIILSFVLSLIVQV